MKKVVGKLLNIFGFILSIYLILSILYLWLKDI